MVKCEKCKRFFFSKKRFQTFKYGEKNLLICPYCIKEKKVVDASKIQDEQRIVLIERQKKKEELEKNEIEKYSDFLNDFGNNYEQKRAVVSDSDRILVLAGAGSGKTKVLTKRFIHLVKNKSIPIHDILAVTFTKEARNEMVKRISKSLNMNEEL